MLTFILCHVMISNLEKVLLHVNIRIYNLNFLSFLLDGLTDYQYLYSLNVNLKLIV